MRKNEETQVVKLGARTATVNTTVKVPTISSVKIDTGSLKAISAGCNLILHCNAKHSEMRIVAENTPLVDNFIIKKTSQFYNFLS